MVKLTSSDSVKDQMEKGLDNLTLSDSRKSAGDGTTSKNSDKSTLRNNGQTEPNEENHVNEKESVSEVTEGVNPTVAPQENRDSSSDDDSSDDESSEDEEIKAPVELIGEFLQYVRTSDWENAAKLCKMILIYEPDNTVALQFQTVIEEKSQIEKELAEMSSSSEEEDDTSDTDEDSSAEEPDVEDAETAQSDDESAEAEFTPRAGSSMKNPLVFAHQDPVWKP